MQNKRIIFTVVGVLILAGVFYGGMVYGQSRTNTLQTGRFGDIQNRNGGMMQFSGGNRNNRIMGGGFVNGEIISKDDKSITVKITNVDQNQTSGGSKIVFFDTTTVVSKMINGATSDLTTNTPVSIIGTTNADGSITAKSIQIRNRPQ